MEKTLEYRRASFRLYYFALAICFLSEIFIFSAHLGKFLGDSIQTTVIRLLTVSSLPLASFIYLILFIRPQIRSRYWLDPNRLIVDDLKSEHEIAFKNIKKVSILTSSPRFFSGFIIHLKNGVKFRIPSALSGNLLVLEAICRDRPELFSENTLIRYILTSRMVDVSWARMWRKINYWPVLVLKYFAFVIFLVMIWWSKYYPKPPVDMGQKLVVVLGFHFLYVGVWGLMINHLEERVFMHLFRKQDPMLPDTSASWEKTLGFLAQIVFWTTCPLLYYFLFLR